jgi:hypothetical protein
MHHALGNVDVSRRDITLPASLKNDAPETIARFGTEHPDSRVGGESFDDGLIRGWFLSHSCGATHSARENIDAFLLLGEGG